MVGPLMEIIIYVSNMETQVRFYRDILGLKVAQPVGMSDYSQQYWVEFDTGACTLALHGGGAMRFGDDAPKFVFQVDDTAVARENLFAKGVQVSDIRSPAPGVSVVDGWDPEGNRFSLECRSPQ
jgi:predicted enzyme related to lactoylglutathione lyase